MSAKSKNKPITELRQLLSSFKLSKMTHEDRMELVTVTAELLINNPRTDNHGNSYGSLTGLSSIQTIEATDILLNTYKKLSHHVIQANHGGKQQKEQSAILSRFLRFIQQQDKGKGVSKDKMDPQTKLHEVVSNDSPYTSNGNDENNNETKIGQTPPNPYEGIFVGEHDVRDPLEVLLSIALDSKTWRIDELKNNAESLKFATVASVLKTQTVVEDKIIKDWMHENKIIDIIRQLFISFRFATSGLAYRSLLSEYKGQLKMSMKLNRNEISQMCPQLDSNKGLIEVSEPEVQEANEEVCKRGIYITTTIC